MKLTKHANPTREDSISRRALCSLPSGRYDVFKPAIEAADLEPYRVDLDPSASIPIEQIESGIRRADVCFAEITSDNPNVWFELGYAIASSKAVVMACAEDRRTRFPFDVQHRAIIKYKTESASDFSALESKITERLKAALKKQIDIGSAATLSPLKETEGLSPHEIAGLVTELPQFLGHRVKQLSLTG